MKVIVKLDPTRKHDEIILGDQKVDIIDGVSVFPDGHSEMYGDELTLTAIARIAVRLGATPKTKITYEIKN